MNKIRMMVDEVWYGVPSLELLVHLLGRNLQRCTRGVAVRHKLLAPWGLYSADGKMPKSAHTRPVC